MNAVSKKKNNSKTVMIVAAVLVLAIIVAVVCFNLFGSQKTAKNTLEGYFTALYCETRINNMTPFLVEGIRELCYNDFTLNGTRIEILRAYQNEKIELVGENMSLSVKINKEEQGSASALGAASKSYGATSLVDVTFTVTFKGDQGTADFTGIARLVKVSGKWYLTEYNLPLVEK